MAVDLFLPELEGSQKLTVNIYSHGFKGFKDWGFVPHLHEFFVSEDCAFITYNYSHNGVRKVDFDELDKFAENTITQEIRDMESLAFWIANEGSELYNLHPEKLNWIGHSRGGANTIIFADLYPHYCQKIVTWSAINNYSSLFANLDKDIWKTANTLFIKNSRTNQEMPLNYSIWDDYINNETKYNVELAASRLTVPWLIVHGKLDEVVPFEQALSLYNACNHSVLITVDEANHTFGNQHPMLNLGLAPEYFWIMMDNTRDFLDEEIEELS
jgi:hypothetical protein